MLHEFLTANRQELIKRCRQRVAERLDTYVVGAGTDQGVPLLLAQMAETLLIEKSTAVREDAETESPEIEQDAGRHGAELLRLGYTVEQVVHEYGDVCQAVTGMAVERNEPISTDEFRTMNLCLDNAIAGAVTGYGQARRVRSEVHAQTLHGRLNTFTHEHRRLVAIATDSFAAIRTGNVGLTGATGVLLVHALDELRSLAERTLPEIHLVSEAIVTKQ